MSKRLFKTMVAVLAIAAAAAGPVRGQNASPDVTLDFTTNDWALPITGTNHGPEDYSNGTYSITLSTPSSGTNTYRFNSGCLLLGRSGAYLQLPAFSSPVEKIEVVGTSVASAYVEQNVFVDENNEWVAVSTQTMGMKDTTQTYVIDENYRAAGNIYYIKVESNANTQITYIKVYYVSSGGGSGSETPTPGQNGNLLTTITPTGLTTYDETTPGVVNVIFDGQLEYYNNDGWQAEYGNGYQGSVTVTANTGFSIDSCKFYGDEDSYTVTAAPFAVYPYCSGSLHIVYSQPNAQGSDLWYGGVKRIDVYGSAVPQPHTVRMAAGTEEAANWSLASGNASVPGTQVLENVMSGSELTATYNGTQKVKSVKAVKYVAPAATVTTAPTATAAYIEANSTSALVNAGAANGGTMMYAVTTTNAQPASTADFSATIPTAQGRSAGTYYVWYYAKADANHSDSEIAGPVSVTLAVMTTVTINQSDWGTTGKSFTKDGVTVSVGSIDRGYGNITGGGTFSTTLGKFTRIVVTTGSCEASGTGWSGGTWTGTPASTVSFSGNFMGMGMVQTTFVCTIAQTN